MSNDLFNSIVSKVAIHVPMFAKAFLEAGLEKINANPETVTPAQMKKVLDEYVFPKLNSFVSKYCETEIMGGGTIRTNAENCIIYFSHGIAQYIELEGNLNTNDSSLFEKLYKAGLVIRIEDFVQSGELNMSRKVCIEKPYKSVLDVTFISLTEQGKLIGTISSIRDITLSEKLIEEVSSLYEKVQEQKDEIEKAYNKLTQNRL